MLQLCDLWKWLSVKERLTSWFDSFPRIFFAACRWTLTALNGSFSSPNYPSPYKKKAWCEWHINVPWNYIISLTFVDFRLETSDMCLFQSCDCDYVEIHDNFPNGTSELTGKYCMGVAYPPGDIRSKTNNVTVTFTSDGTVQDVGFKAEYHALQLTSKNSSLLFIIKVVSKALSKWSMLRQWSGHLN